MTDQTAGIIITAGAAIWIAIAVFIFWRLNKDASRIEIERIED